MNTRYAIADCNNFYASCERVFNPALRNRPVVVLSNNDGCVIARSMEAKQIGIGMGTPAFKCRKDFEKHDVKVLSSNYPLYGDMSRRVMETLSRFTDAIEVYSIDEAFMKLEIPRNTEPEEYAAEIRNTVKKWTGLPVSIGLAPTKTLAKIANFFCKKNELRNGVLDISTPEKIDACLKRIPVSEIWGIGKNYAQFLESRGIQTGLDLKNTPDRWVKKNLKVTGLRTVNELRGIPCIQLEEVIEPRKGILSSRSFGKPVDDPVFLSEAVHTYIARAAEKLRDQHSLATRVQVFLKTNKYSPDFPYYNESASVSLPGPSAFTPDLAAAAEKALQEIWLPGLYYQKAGVMLHGIVDAGSVQGNFFADKKPEKKQTSLMEAVDGLNRKLGKNSLWYASSGDEKPWKMKQEYKSPSYTTKWDDLPVVKGGCLLPLAKSV